MTCRTLPVSSIRTKIILEMANGENFMMYEARSKAHSRARKKREFYQLALADTDVRTAINVADDFIDLLNEWRRPKLPYHLSEAFVAYIAVSYSRPFVQTRRSSVPVLPPRWGQFADKRLQRTHDLILRVRHELFAHTDPSLRKLMIIPAGVFMKEIGRIAPRTSYMMTAQTLPPTAIGELRVTCVDLQTRLQARLNELLDDLYGGMEMPQRKFPFRFDDGF
jgi:hypothetical protein